MDAKKIILFGGTFDPIHLGHISVTSCAAEHINSEKVIFIPAKQSPLKSFSPAASDEDRIKMIHLVISEKEQFEVSDHELTKTGPSYTIETIRHFKTEYGADTEVYWLIGADSLEELPGWYKIDELIDECNLCVMYRGGYPKPDFGRFESLWDKARIEKLQQNIIQTPLININSTEIRTRLCRGEDISEMVDKAVAEYIYEHGLYQSK